MAIPPQENKAKQHFQQGMQELGKGHHRKALGWLRLATKMDPEKALYWFNLGNLYFVLKNFREAQLAYRQVQALESPLAPVARLYEVRSLRHSSRLPPAYRLYLQLERGLFPEALKKELEEERILLSEALLEKGLKLWGRGKSRHARHHFRASADLVPSIQVYRALALLEWREGSKKKGRYYHRRALRLTRSHSDVVELHKDWQKVDPGKVSLFWAESGLIRNSNFFQDDSNTDGDVGFGFKFHSGLQGFLAEGDTWDLSGRLSATHIDYSNLDDQETTDFGLSLPFAWQLGNRHKWRFTPKLEQELYAGKPLQLHVGGKAEWVRPLSVGRVVGAYGEIIRSQAQNDDFSYLDGATLGVGASYTWIWSRSRIRLGISAEDYQANPYEGSSGESLPLGYHRWDLGVLYSLRGDVWEGYGGLSFGEKSYPDFLLPDNKLREDQAISIRSGVEWVLADEYKIFVEVEWMNNSSTLGESASINKNYSQSVIYLGGRWIAEK